METTGVPSFAAISTPLTVALAAPEPHAHGAGGRPVELASERAERQRFEGRRGTRGRLAQRRLQTLLRHLQFAGQLRVEVAPAVDVGQERVLPGHRALRRGLRPGRFDAQRRERCAAGSQRGAGCLERRKALLVRQNPLAVPALDGGDKARGLGHLPCIGGRHEQPQVASLAEFVQIDEAGLDRRPLRDVFGLEASHFGIERAELGRSRRDVRLDAPELFSLDLAIDLELAEIAEQRARLGRESVGLLLQHAQAVAGPLRARFGAVAARRLRRSRRDRQARGEPNHEPHPDPTAWASYHVKCGDHIICLVSSRVLGIDVGRRRIGLAISDRSRTLARPLTTLEVSPATAVAEVGREIDRLAAEEDGLAEIIVGLPVRLDGSANDETPRVAAFVDALRRRTTVPVRTGDERLTSVEAESRLALNERDWKKRKARLDAAAAAVILQDYLDTGNGEQGTGNRDRGSEGTGN